MSYNHYYQTNNLGLATALVAVGAMLVRIDKTNPSRAIFVFEKDDRLEELIDEYWSKVLMVPALTHFDTIKQLKSRLYS